MDSKTLKTALDIAAAFMTSKQLVKYRVALLTAYLEEKVQSLTADILLFDGMRGADAVLFYSKDTVELRKQLIALQTQLGNL